MLSHKAQDLCSAQGWTIVEGDVQIILGCFVSYIVLGDCLDRWLLRRVRQDVRCCWRYSTDSAEREVFAGCTVNSVIQVGRNDIYLEGTPPQRFKTPGLRYFAVPLRFEGFRPLLSELKI